MNKITFLAVSLLALLAVSSCTKDEIIESIETPQSEIPEGYFKPVLKADLNPIANHPLDKAQSRHYVGMDGKVNWMEGDTLLVAVLKENDPEDKPQNTYLYAPSYTFLYSASEDDFKQATNEKQLYLSKDTVYRWIVVNPGTYNKKIRYTRNEQGNIKDDTRVIYTSFTATTQSKETPNKHLAKLDEMQGMCSVKGNPFVIMDHLGTLMKFEIVNSTGKPFNLQGFRMEASNTEVMINGAVDVLGSWSGSPSTEVTLNGTCALEAGESYTVATIVKDFGLKAQESLKIHVRTDKGIFIKDYPIKQDITFAAGTWNSATVRVTANGMTQYDDNNLYIPDPIFRKSLTDACNKETDAALSKTDLEGITELSIMNGGSISSLQGLEYLTNLSKFTLYSYNNPNIDFSNNEQLQNLDLGQCRLKELKLEKNTKLTSLDVNHNQLKELNLTNQIVLTELKVSGNLLTELNLNSNQELIELNATENQLKKVNLVNNIKLTNLDVSYNQLKELNLEGNIALEVLKVGENQLKKLNLEKNTGLKELVVYRNQLKELNLEKNTALEGLYAESNQLKELNVGKNTALESLDANSNQLKELNLEKNTKLTMLAVSRNQLKELNLEKNTKLRGVDVSRNQLTEIDILNCTQIEDFNATKNPNLQVIWVWEGFDFNTPPTSWLPAVTKDLYKVKKDFNFDMDDFGKGNEDFLK